MSILFIRDKLLGPAISHGKRITQEPEYLEMRILGGLIRVTHHSLPEQKDFTG